MCQAIVCVVFAVPRGPVCRLTLATAQNLAVSTQYNRSAVDTDSTHADVNLRTISLALFAHMCNELCRMTAIASRLKRTTAAWTAAIVLLTMASAARTDAVRIDFDEHGPNFATIAEDYLFEHGLRAPNWRYFEPNGGGQTVKYPFADGWGATITTMSDDIGQGDGIGWFLFNEPVNYVEANVWLQSVVGASWQLTGLDAFGHILDQATFVSDVPEEIGTSFVGSTLRIETHGISAVAVTRNAKLGMDWLAFDPSSPFNPTPVGVPEEASSLALLGLGLVALVPLARRKRNANSAPC